MSDLTNDVDFVQSMHDLMDMDKDAVEKLIDDMDTDDLQDLVDAVANQDRDAVQRIVGRFDTDEEVNSLFRGEHLQSDSAKSNRRKSRPVSQHADKQQFGFGDDVKVRLRDKNNHRHYVTGTVSNPHGPEGTDTVAVRIKGKTKMVHIKDIRRLSENVVGIVGMPDIGRVQQLAGIQTAQSAVPQTMIAPQVDPNEPTCQAMAALDTLEQVLPNLKVLDLKTVRQRLLAIQQIMNEESKRASIITPLRERR